MKSMFSAAVAVSLCCQVSVAQEASRRFVTIDLNEHCNQKLDAPFHDLTREGHNLSMVPKGQQELCGVPFRIGDGCLQFATSADDGRNLRPLPVHPLASRRAGF